MRFDETIDDDIAAFSRGELSAEYERRWRQWIADIRDRGAAILTQGRIEALRSSGFDDAPATTTPPSPGQMRRLGSWSGGGGPMATSRFMDINARWSQMRSSTLHRRLSDDPGQWEEYHDEYASQRRRWECVPAEIIADEIERLWPGRSRTIADLGCGRDSLLARRLEAIGSHHVVTGFDHVSSGPNVVARDFSTIGDEYSGVFDIAVLSLALVGTNRWDYFGVAGHLLTTDGCLIVAETSGRHFDAGGLTVPERLDQEGMDVVGTTELPGGFMMTRARK